MIPHVCCVMLEKRAHRTYQYAFARFSAHALHPYGLMTMGSGGSHLFTSSQNWDKYNE